MTRIVLAIAMVCATVGSASARMVVYTARSGDTAESIAADYYGNRSLALFISEGNGLGREGRLRPGQKVRIPTAFRYKVRRGDTFEGLAQKFLDDKRRAALLASFSGLKISDKLREGQELVIPFQHLHQAEAPESLASVARAFYGEPSKAKLLQDFNFRTSPMLAKGEKIVVPIAHVRIRSVRLQAPPPPKPAAKKDRDKDKEKEPVAPALAAADAKEAQKREEELAQRVGAQLAMAEKSYKDGSYSDVPAALDKLLTDEDPSESQLAEIFKLKAFSYVALGMDELAVNAFREVIARKPDLAFDEATVSPKIRAALDKARKTP